ncbi:MAG: S24 family peptidase [Paracoccaceae bacterium]
MEHAEQILAARVRERLDELATNAFAFEKAHGLKSDAIRSILRGDKKSGTTLNKAQEVCRALGLEFHIGPKRDLSAPPPEIVVNGEEFATVKRLDVEASAGPGVFNGEHSEVGSMAFRRDWLRKLGVKAEQAVLITVKGQSMEPTLLDGDVVLVDKTKAQLINGKVFAVTDLDGSVRVKRLFQPKPGMMVLQSDNRGDDYPPEIRTGAELNRLRIEGQVVWSGHKWG